MSNRAPHIAAAVAFDLAKPSTPCPVYLIRVLREGPDGPLWPEVNGKPFRWNYGWPCQCGMGLSSLLWPTINRHNICAVGGAFGLSFDAAETVFWNQHLALGFSGCRGRDLVTPAHVADALERALTRAWRAA